MITIQNISKQYGKGQQDYFLKVPEVNEKPAVYIEFEHKYEDGLASCLRRAANAVDEYNGASSFTKRIMKYPGKVEIYKDSNNEYRWKMLTHNNNVIATSGEGYLTKRGVKKSLEAIFKRNYIIK